MVVRSLLLLCAFLWTWASATTLQRHPIAQPPSSPSVAPSAAILRWWALGYPQLMADGFWLAAIHHFGDGRMHASHYPQLVPLMERVVQLDPYFAGAYQFIGTAMTLKEMPIEQPMAWLALGTALRPDQWKIPFLWGFHLYYFELDPWWAGYALGLAARHGEAPPHLGLLASRLAAQAGDPQTGLALIETLLQQAPSEQRREELMVRYNQLLHETYRNVLEQAAKRWHQHRGEPLQDLSQLLQEHLIDNLPPEPLGGSWQIANGQITSSSESLRLHPPMGTTAYSSQDRPNQAPLQSATTLPTLGE